MNNESKIYSKQLPASILLQVFAFYLERLGKV